MESEVNTEVDAEVNAELPIGAAITAGKYLHGPGRPYVKKGWNWIKSKFAEVNAEVDAEANAEVDAKANAEVDAEVNAEIPSLDLLKSSKEFFKSATGP